MECKNNCLQFFAVFVDPGRESLANGNPDYPKIKIRINRGKDTDVNKSHALAL